MQSLDTLRPPQTMDCVGTVQSSVWLTPTIKAIRLQLDQPTFRFLPGQSVWVKLERNGKEFTKIYSIASSPSHCPQVELCVSRVGWGSIWIQDLPIGGTVALRSPYGLMTLDRLPARPRVYIAEGSGIAPLKSHLDWLHETGFDQSVVLIQANPETPDQLPYAEYWRSLQPSWPTFSYIPVTQRTDTALMRQSIDWQKVEVDICAVGDRVDQLLDTVLLLGARSERVRSEKFVAY